PPPPTTTSPSTSTLSGAASATSRPWRPGIGPEIISGLNSITSIKQGMAGAESSKPRQSENLDALAGASRTQPRPPIVKISDFAYDSLRPFTDSQLSSSLPLLSVQHPQPVHRRRL